MSQLAKWVIFNYNLCNLLPLIPLYCMNNTFSINWSGNNSYNRIFLNIWTYRTCRQYICVPRKPQIPSHLYQPIAMPTNTHTLQYLSATTLPVPRTTTTLYYHHHHHHPHYTASIKPHLWVQNILNSSNRQT